MNVFVCVDFCLASVGLLGGMVGVLLVAKDGPPCIAFVSRRDCGRSTAIFPGTEWGLMQPYWGSRRVVWEDKSKKQRGLPFVPPRLRHIIRDRGTKRLSDDDLFNRRTGIKSVKTQTTLSTNHYHHNNKHSTQPQQHGAAAASAKRSANPHPYSHTMASPDCLQGSLKPHRQSYGRCSPFPIHHHAPAAPHCRLRFRQRR